MAEGCGPGLGGRRRSAWRLSWAQPAQRQTKCLWQYTAQLLTVICHHRAWATPHWGEGPPEGSALNTKTAFPWIALYSALWYVPVRPTPIPIIHFYIISDIMYIVYLIWLNSHGPGTTGKLLQQCPNPWHWGAEWEYFLLDIREINLIPWGIHTFNQQMAMYDVVSSTLCCPPNVVHILVDFSHIGGL